MSALFWHRAGTDSTPAIQKLEREIDERIDEGRSQFHYKVIRKRIEFEQQVRKGHRKLRVSSFKYLFESGLAAIVFAPVVYMLIFPLVLLDLFVSFFQMVCFPVYGMEKVKRSDYIAVDRHHLAYLNWIERLNCAYCGYANGLLAYTRAIAGRAEEHWCPIKHARRIKGPQVEYFEFAPYGDAEGYRSKENHVSEQHFKRVERIWREDESDENDKEK